jgi:hypothetical protein
MTKHSRYNQYKFYCFFISYKKKNEVKQHNYLQIVQLNFHSSTYTDNPYLTQCLSIHGLAHIYMLAPTIRHPWTSLN